jgi:hypothetical protein
MKHDLELKLQAWLDGELPEREARRIGEWVARDSEAAALAAELRHIRQALPGNETPKAVPDSREFYWSQIERRVRIEAPAGRTARSPFFVRWQGYLLPLTGVAAVACALVVMLRPAVPTFDEISSTNEGMEAVTFHDQSGQMTVVWLQDNSPQSEPAQAAATPAQPPDEPDVELE